MNSAQSNPYETPKSGAPQANAETPPAELPIATYHEARLGLSRRFELFADRIKVVGYGIHYGKFDIAIPLAILYPEVSRTWTRSFLFRYGTLSTGFTVLATFIMFMLGNPHGFDAIFSPWAKAILAAMWTISLSLLIITARPIEFAGFYTSAGLTTLSVGRVGPDAIHFDRFVQLLTERIRLVRQAEQNGAHSTGTPGIQNN